MLKKLHTSALLTFVAVTEAFAQTTAPATPGSPVAPATESGGTNWLWIIVALLIVAAALWYFLRGRSRTAITGTTGTTGTTTSRTGVYDKDKPK